MNTTDKHQQLVQLAMPPVQCWWSAFGCNHAATNAGWRLGARLLVDLGAWWFSLQDGDDLACFVSILFQPIGSRGLRLHGGK